MPRRGWRTYETRGISERDISRCALTIEHEDRLEARGRALLQLQITRLLSPNHMKKYAAPELQGFLYGEPTQDISQCGRA